MWITLKRRTDSLRQISIPSIRVVTYCVKKLIRTCSPMIVQVFWYHGGVVIMTHQIPSLGKCWKLWSVVSPRPSSPIVKENLMRLTMGWHFFFFFSARNLETVKTATALIWNSTARTGNIVVPGKKGKAIVWYNYDLDGHTGWMSHRDDRSLHGGCIVKKGMKYIAALRHLN